MKKVIVALAAAALSVVGLAAPANATHNFGLPHLDLETPANPQLKVDICHNGTIIPVSINAVLTAQDTGHGLLTLLPGLPPSINFVARVDVPGHSGDTVLRVYLKAGNVESNIVVLSGTCTAPEPEPEPEEFDASVRVCLAGVVHTFAGTGLSVEAALADATAKANVFIGANVGAVILVGNATCELPKIELPKLKVCLDFKTRAELEGYLGGLTAELLAKANIELDGDKDGILCDDLTDKVTVKEVEKKVEVPGPTQVVVVEKTTFVPVEAPKSLPRTS